MLMQGETAVHDPPTGPADEDVLQFPNTASSGRRLIRTTFGASYVFSLGGTLGSSLIRSLSAPYLSERPVLHIRRKLRQEPDFDCLESEKASGGWSIRRRRSLWK